MNYEAGSGRDDPAGMKVAEISHVYTISASSTSFNGTLFIHFVIRRILGDVNGEIAHTVTLNESDKTTNVSVPD